MGGLLLTSSRRKRGGQRSEMPRTDWSDVETLDIQPWVYISVQSTLFFQEMDILPGYQN